MMAMRAWPRAVPLVVMVTGAWPRAAPQHALGGSLQAGLQVVAKADDQQALPSEVADSLLHDATGHQRRPERRVPSLHYQPTETKDALSSLRHRPSLINLALKRALEA